MDDVEVKRVVENLINTFLVAGEVSIKLREKGLIKDANNIDLERIAANG